MHDAVQMMLAGFSCKTRDDTLHAIREILQSLALLGLWRCRFFEHAAFYGGTALRVIHGLDRFSEDLDFSLLHPNPGFSLGRFGDALKREIESFGFRVEFSTKIKTINNPIQSAFLKANAYQQLISITPPNVILDASFPVAPLKIKLEVDTIPPSGFHTETRYLSLPIPFAVRVYCLPDLFAGKLHAVLFRKWKNRVKGRDWFDLAWYANRHPNYNLAHLEARMRQSGDFIRQNPLSAADVNLLLNGVIDELNIDSARREVEPFLADPRSVDLWSRDYFRHLISRISVAV